MPKEKFIFITGGARSGKSSFAEQKALELGGKVTYIATCAPKDDEMVIRVAKHRERRPKNWQTVEEEFIVDEVVAREGKSADVILIDCLTLFVTNLLLVIDHLGNYAQEAEKSVLARIELLAHACKDSTATVLIVSNETGMGLVPDNETGRLFRDVLGRANQLMASFADEVYFMVAGIPLKIK